MVHDKIITRTEVFVLSQSDSGFCHQVISHFSPSFLFLFFLTVYYYNQCRAFNPTASASQAQGPYVAPTMSGFLKALLYLDWIHKRTFGPSNHIFKKIDVVFIY